MFGFFVFYLQVDLHWDETQLSSYTPRTDLHAPVTTSKVDVK